MVVEFVSECKDKFTLLLMYLNLELLQDYVRFFHTLIENRDNGGDDADVKLVPTTTQNSLSLNPKLLHSHLQAVCDFLFIHCMKF